MMKNIFKIVLLSVVVNFQCLFAEALMQQDCKTNGDKTVSCSDTGLMWQDDSSDVGIVRKNWLEAISYCEDLSLAGHDDWRLPNIIELQSITDRQNKYNPCLKDGFSVQSSGYFLSSTTYKVDSTLTWGVRFELGNEYRGNKTITYFVRCVR